MDRESILRHVYGTVACGEANLDRSAAVLPSPPRRKPMLRPVTTGWNLDISATDFTQLKLGFRGQNQDHKWTIAAGDQDENGVVLIHIIRRGASMERYVLHLKPPADNNGAKIGSFTWDIIWGADDKTAISEQQAKEEAILLCRVHAGCKFENLPKYKASIFWGPRTEVQEKNDGENAMG
ncbi:hypothetical protein PspLS_06413 [Pyricularia sp. CBS 133598]|nr:hypothetical protein PspLS_06413 [Pyricularia sp. CBS 133598]